MRNKTMPLCLLSLWLAPPAWCAADSLPLAAHTLSLSLQEAAHGALLLVFKDLESRDCSHLQVQGSTAPGRLDLRVLAEPPKFACMMKEPLPASGAFKLPPEPGSWRLSVTSALGTDQFALSYSSAAASFKPEGAARIAKADETGEFLRIPSHSLWVELTYGGRTGRQKLQAKGQAFLEELRRLGAREIAPPAGRYLINQRVWLALAPGRRPNPSEPVERRYFVYEGDFAAVQKLFERFRKHDRSHSSGEDYLSLFIGGWDGERLNSTPY
ncbi:MAG: hypothetical protein NTY77_18950 [Elusimicrobia bacterium]|nr:hypothetical protein [Elusimicrobiota bacterium]